VGCVFRGQGKARNEEMTELKRWLKQKDEQLGEVIESEFWGSIVAHATVRSTPFEPLSGITHAVA
jgi:hypothetical protein